MQGTSAAQLKPASDVAAPRRGRIEHERLCAVCRVLELLGYVLCSRDRYYFPSFAHAFITAIFFSITLAPFPLLFWSPT